MGRPKALQMVASKSYKRYRTIVLEHPHGIILFAPDIQEIQFFLDCKTTKVGRCGTHVIPFSFKELLLD